jgi:predicted ATPase
LSTIVPDVVGVDDDDPGPWETLRFRKRVPGEYRFYASAMSDGPLRVLGILVAVAQLADGTNPVRLMGIEEPETALHPAASAALMDALKEAAVTGQVIVTTQSPDLLDRVEFDSDRVLVAEMRDGATVIGPASRAVREAVEEHLCSAGELLRMDQFQPDWRDLERQKGLLEAAGPSE